MTSDPLWIAIGENGDRTSAPDGFLWSAKPANTWQRHRIEARGDNMHRTRILILVLCSWSAWACGGATVVTPDDAGEVQTVNEDCPVDTPEFAEGDNGLVSSNADGSIAVKIIHADHNPPAKDFNTWTIAVDDRSGAALADAQLTFVCAWMAHGHGSNPRTITKLGDGRFELGKQNLSMNGPWEVRFWIDPTGSSEDYTPQSARGTALTAQACIPPAARKTQQPDVTLKFCVPRELR